MNLSEKENIRLEIKRNRMCCLMLARNLRTPRRLLIIRIRRKSKVLQKLKVFKAKNDQKQTQCRKLDRNQQLLVR
jgi:hypothetical protein